MKQRRQKPADDAPPASKAPVSAAPSHPSGWSRWWRTLLSLVFLWHLGNVFLYAWANSRSSPTIVAVSQQPPMRWYAQALYLDHGHGFFGPDPPLGQFIKFRVVGDDGQVVQEGRFPDAERMSPRLWYHRHKMLADQTAIPIPELERDMLQAYARHLLRVHDGERAELTRVSHYPIRLDDWLPKTELDERGEVVATRPGRPLDDPATYQETIRVVQTRADLDRVNEPDDGVPPEPERVESIPQGAPVP